MRALERDLGDLQDFALTLGIAEEDIAIAHPCALLHFFLATEPEDLRPGASTQSNAGRIVGVQHSEIASLLVLENSGLGIRINLECSVAIQMVGRDVQHDGNLRAEGVN